MGLLSGSHLTRGLGRAVCLVFCFPAFIDIFPNTVFLFGWTFCLILGVFFSFHSPFSLSLYFKTQQSKRLKLGSIGVVWFFFPFSPRLLQ